MRSMLEVIIEAGPRLITAGYTAITIGGVDLRLAPALPVPAGQATPAADPVARQRVDPMRDPSTFPGGHVPRYVDDTAATIKSREYPSPPEQSR